MWHALLVLIGVVVLAKVVYKMYLVARVHMVTLDATWSARFGKDPWAAVTGCTGGIGREFALKLASLGFNIILIARN